MESLITLQPDINFSGPGDQATITSYTGADELGLTYTIVSEYLEDSSDAFLEWIKFFAAFYNLDEKADMIYEKKLKYFKELSALTESIPPAERPVVAVGSAWKGVVYTPASNSSSAQEMERAGAVYYLKDLPGGSLRIGMEEFFQSAKDADVLIYTSMIYYTPDKQALLEENPLFAEFKAYKNDRIYVLSDGYYMNAAAVDIKFEEMISLLYPDLLPKYEFLFYEKLPDRAAP